jgi:eukaryotic-like serine/threonine-protein kinase
MGQSREGRTVGATAAEDADLRAGAALFPGMMVGEYQVEGLLGEGGMGRVYAAVHPLIAKRAAIKVLRPELSNDPVAVERFVREARSVNQIGHPNIVDIFAFGTLADGRHYFVMEWLQGESLATRVSRGPLPLPAALDVLDAIASALEAAHATGIVHRDLKPDNVFLSTGGGTAPMVKLLDFGIAKLLGTDPGIDRTATGALIGTPAYMSPEQARGEQVDTRTDLYALGTVAFEVLTGQMVFGANTGAEMVARHLFERPRVVSSLRSDVPAPLDALITRLLAKEMTARPSLAEVRDTIARSRSHASAPTVATPAVRPSRSRGVLIAALAVAGAAIGIAVALWPSTPIAPAAPTAPASIVAPAPTVAPPVTHPDPAPPQPTAAPPAATAAASETGSAAEPSVPRAQEIQTPAHRGRRQPPSSPQQPSSPQPTHDDPDAPL